MKVALAERLAALLRRDPDAGRHRRRGRPRRPGLAGGARPAPDLARPAPLDVVAAVPRAVVGAASRRSWPASACRRSRRCRGGARRPARASTQHARRRVHRPRGLHPVHRPAPGDEAAADAARRAPPGRRAGRPQPGRPGREAARRRAHARRSPTRPPPCTAPSSCSTPRPTPLRLRAGVHCGEVVVHPRRRHRPRRQRRRPGHRGGRGRRGARHRRRPPRRPASCAASTLLARPAPALQGRRRAGRGAPGRARALSVDRVARRRCAFQRSAASATPALSSPLYAALARRRASPTSSAGGPCAAVLAAAPPGARPDRRRRRAAVPRRRAPARARRAGAGAGPLVPDRRRRASTRRPATRRAATSSPRSRRTATSWSRGSTQGVQTNEVGRCAALAVGFTELLRRLRAAAAAARDRRVGRAQPALGPLALRVRRRRRGATPTAPLRFADATTASRSPDLSAPLGPDAAVRRAPGLRPVADRPDDRRRAGSCCARSCGPTRPTASRASTPPSPSPPRCRPTVDAADAGDVARRRSWPTPAPASTTVVVPLDRVAVPAAGDAATACVDALGAAGAGRRADAPLAWLRMEPGDDPAKPAELRLTTLAGRRRAAPRPQRLPRPPRLAPTGSTTAPASAARRSQQSAQGRGRAR